MKIDISNQAILANTVNNLRRQRHPEWSRDQLLCHPREARRVCALVRSEMHFAGALSDFEILWAYLNFSKRSKLASCLPRRKHR